MLYLAYKHGREGLLPALLANTNLGGDNTSRGALLGAVLGCLEGVKAVPEDVKCGLFPFAELSALVDAFVGICLQPRGSSVTMPVTVTAMTGHTVTTGTSVEEDCRS